MSAIASPITGVLIVYSIVYSGVDQRKYESSASLAFVGGIHRWPVNSPHKGPVTRKMFPFDDVIMCSEGSCFVVLCSGFTSVDFTHIHQGYFISTVRIGQLSLYPWSNTEWYEWIDATNVHISLRMFHFSYECKHYEHLLKPIFQCISQI